MGQLGHGSSPADEPAPQSVGLPNVYGVAAGANHTCVLQADFAIQCAGANVTNQLGNASVSSTSATMLAVPALP